MGKLSDEVEPKICKCGCLIYNHVDSSIKEYTICSKCLEQKIDRKRTTIENEDL